MVSSSVPLGGQTEAWALMVKKAANRALKNITSEPSQIMTPTAIMGGRSGRCRAGVGCSTARASVTAYFLVDAVHSGPTLSQGRFQAWPRQAAGDRWVTISCQSRSANGAGRGAAWTNVRRWVGRVRATYRVRKPLAVVPAIRLGSATT